jgi:ABC-type transporter Mla MlaB component
MTTSNPRLPSLEFLLRLQGTLDAPYAAGIVGVIEGLRPGEALTLDFSQMTDCEDAALTLLAPFLREPMRQGRLLVAGLGGRQRQILGLSEDPTQPPPGGNEAQPKGPSGDELNEPPLEAARAALASAKIQALEDAMDKLHAACRTHLAVAGLLHASGRGSHPTPAAEESPLPYARA